MIDVDELDLLRRPGEKVIWRDKPVASWRWALFQFMLLLVANVANSLVNGVDWGISIAIIVGGLFIVGLVGGGPVEHHTLVTDVRILRLGAVRRLRSRRDPPYSTALAEIDRVSLRDEGLNISVEVHHADTRKIDVLRANQPHALATAIANAAGLDAPPPFGRLDEIARVCNLIGLAFAFLSWHQIEAMLDGALGLGPAADPSALSSLIYFPSIVATVICLLFVSVVAQLPFAAVAMLVMPHYASAEEAETWFGLRPSRWLFRWTGWKSRPYRWLANLAFGRASKAAA